MGLDAMIFVFWMLSFKPTFSLSSFTFIKGLFTSCHKCGIICIWGYWYFSRQSWFQHTGKQNVILFFWQGVGGSDGKEATCNVGDLGSIPGLGKSPQEGNRYPLQYCGLGNSMNRGAWQATVHGVTKSWIQLSNFHLTMTINTWQEGWQIGSPSWADKIGDYIKDFKK